MSNPLSDLQELAKIDGSITGVVHAIENAQILLATQRGLQQVPYVDGFDVGDRVKFKNGQLIKEVPSQKKLPIYWV